MKIDILPALSDNYMYLVSFSEYNSYLELYNDDNKHLFLKDTRKYN